MGSKPPADLDREARRKWAELIEIVDPDVDSDLVANYARMHGSLMAIRTEKARQIKARTYETLVRGRDGSQVLNPLQVAENRMVSALNRQLRTLGLAPSAEEQGRRKRKPQSGPPPPGFSGPEPGSGWAVEVALCRGKLDPTPAETELERQRDQWLADRRNR